jgi:hypothetical protein
MNARKRNSQEGEHELQRAASADDCSVFLRKELNRTKEKEKEK